jgi:putative ABC transport system permease protein
MVLKALVFRPLLREKTRTAITILGIAVGVAVVVAIQLANQSALRAFRESVDAVAGRANYQIVSEAAPLSEETLLALQPLWREGVRFAPVIDVEGLVEPAQVPVRLLAVDLLSDLHFRDYRYAKVRKGTFDLFANDAVIVPAPFAKEHGLMMGSPLTLNILGNTRRMTVRGILEAQGPATAFNGAIAVCDIATAQKAFGLSGRLTRIDLLVPNDEVLKRIKLPPGARIERPSRRNERVEKMLRAFRVNLFALAGVALLVGMFLVYNTVLISILRRRRDVGVLKTLGAAPGQIFGAFVAEGLLFGAVGSVLGIALGNGLAFAILGLIGKTINSLYVTSRPEAIVLTPGVIAIGMAVGMALSFVSAIQPSVEAARVRPNAFIRTAGSAAGRGRLRVGPTLLCFLAAVLASRLPAFRGIPVAGYLSVLLVVAGFSFLAPAVIRLTSRIPLPFGIVGRLASASLPASLRRTSIASAALSIAIGMMVAVALMVGSFRETVRIWVNQTVSSDLWLRPSKGLSNAGSALFPPRIADELRQVPFVEAFDRARGRDVVLGDSLVTVGSGDFDVAVRFGDLPMVAPRDSRAAIARARREHGVVVSESFSTKFGKGVDDLVAIPGAGKFRITGVYRDYSNDRGTIIMDREDYVRAFRDDAINTIVVYLKPGITREEARRKLEAQFGPRYHAFAVTNGEIRSEVMRIFDQTFLITYALLGVAIVVAVLGIVNTLAALILERTRELALLRVTGLSVGETRIMIVLESSLLGLAATVAGVAMGYALSWILINVINKQSFGWTIEFHTPATLIAASLAVTFLASALAGLLPARIAERIRIATALKSE